MCSICGMYDYHSGEGVRDITAMNAVLAHRGPDASGEYRAGRVVLGHNRLAVIDPKNGAQPMSIDHKGRRYTIVYNGEIYNAPALRSALVGAGIRPRTACDTELVLYSYILYGEDAPCHLNGIFAFCVYDEEEDTLFFARDRLGVKPLYYAEHEGCFYFASEQKSILKGSGMPARLSRDGLFELLWLSPVTLPGSGIFDGIHAVPPAHCGRVTPQGARLFRYWELEAAEPIGGREGVIENTRLLLSDAIKRQLVSDVPLATLLSGGLDSSIISAVAAEEYKKEGRALSTYSFEYEDNKTYAPTLFQPNRDDDYAARLGEWLGTEHTVLTAPTEEVAALLPEAARIRDLPGQADIDSSLLYFSKCIKNRHTVVLSGECADEIFGGYPWFYRPEMLAREHFPWLHEPTLRPSLFDPGIARINEGIERLNALTKEAIAATPLGGYESPEDRTAKIATYLSVNYFMTNLLERKDRMSMAYGLEVRVPFADHRILEYIYNVPIAVKREGGVEKALLRNAMRGILPDFILTRKKSPYPKTHNPRYEEIVRGMLMARLADPASRLAPLLDRRRLEALLSGEDATWFGQLMARPQLIGWLIQLDAFLTEYRVELI